MKKDKDKDKDIIEPPAPLLDMPLPWQRSQWDKLVAAFDSGRMPHAQIFCGNKGLGKREFAFALSLHMFCSSRVNGQGCGECRNCRLVRTEVHPDFVRIRPEKPTSPIKIDEIRALNEFVTRTSESGVAKVVLIEDAEKMNRSSANALLKNLEEPPAGTYFFLVTSREMQLPITIRSRCQLSRFLVPDSELASHWVSEQTGDEQPSELPTLLAGGAPLASIQLMSSSYQEQYKQLFSSLDALSLGGTNPIAETKQLTDTQLPELLGWISSWVSALIRQQNDGTALIVNTGHANLDQLSGRLSLSSLLGFNGLVQQAFKDSLVASNINRQLILENLLMSWQRVTNVSR